jgi:mono/diheme cytochrome c family protein
MMKPFLCIVVALFLAACDSSTTKNNAVVPKDSTVFSEALPESEGELLYLDMKCPTCHGYQGAGDGFLSVGLQSKLVDFSSDEDMGSISDDQLKEAILTGKSASMPGYPQFTDHQVSELVRYIRSFSQEPSE